MENAKQDREKVRQREVTFMQLVQGRNVATLFHLAALYKMYNPRMGFSVVGSGGSHRATSTPV